jgi:hypothetical protein
VIISDSHRYLFIEQPHTACTAIRNELVELYAGRPILDKHATYADFLRVATAEQKRYFIFSGIRSPLDEAVSVYFKYRTDHKGRYSTDPDSLSGIERETFDYVVAGESDYARYLRRFYRRPFDNTTLIAHHRFDHIIRFEHLQRDFGRALELLGLEQVRPLPVVNKTSQRGSHLDYYPPEIRPHAARVFGPFMRKWRYPLPSDWVGIRVPWSWVVAFRVLGVGRYVSRRYLRPRANPAARAALAIIDPARRLAYRVLGW